MKPSDTTDEPSDAGTTEPRGARRKRETRARLLRAAMYLMGERGMAAVSINEITEAADVGFGSFYNHFSSKEDIYSAIIDWAIGGFADALDDSLADISDPAEIVAASVRHTMDSAKQNPIWARFLIREGLTLRGMTGPGLHARLRRDIVRGINDGRFVSADPLMSFLAVASAILAATVVELDFGSVTASARPEAFQNLADLPERTSATALTILGLSAEEASRIARAPAPPIAFSPPG